MFYKNFGWTFQELLACPFDEYVAMLVIMNEQNILESEATDNKNSGSGNGARYSDDSGPLFQSHEYATTAEEAMKPAYRVE